MICARACSSVSLSRRGGRLRMSVLISPVKSTPICRGGRVKALNRRTGCASVRNALQAWAGPTQTRGTRNLFRNRVCSRTGPENRKFRKHLGAELGGFLLIGIQGSHTYSAHFGPTTGRNGSWGETPPGQPDLFAANQPCWPFRRCLMKRSFYNK